MILKDDLSFFSCVRLDLIFSIMAFFFFFFFFEKYILYKVGSSIVVHMQVS